MGASLWFRLALLAVLIAGCTTSPSPDASTPLTSALTSVASSPSTTLSTTSATTEPEAEPEPVDDGQRQPDLATAPLPAMELPIGWGLAAAYGELRIEGSCVYLDLRDRVVIPLWPESFAELDGDGILFVEPDLLFVQPDVDRIEPELFLDGAEVRIGDGPFSEIVTVREALPTCGDHAYHPIVSMRPAPADG